MTQPLYRDRHPLLFALAVMALICGAQTFFLSLPAYVGLLAQARGYSGSQLGSVATAEIAGNTVGSLLVAFVLARQPVRRVIALSLLVMAAANALMAWQPGFGAALVARALSGLGCGTLSGLGMRYLSYGDHAGRRLGQVVLAQSLWSMLMLSLVMPAVSSVTLSYAGLALLALVSLPALLLFDRQDVLLRDSTCQGSVQAKGAYLSLGALAALYGGVGVVWTFIESLGPNVGMSPEAVGTLLGVGSMLALVACLVVPALLVRGQRWAAGLGSLLLCMAATGALAAVHSPWAFSVATVLFLTAWNGSAIALFASTPVYDAVGRHVALAPAFLGLGYGVGSSLGGLLLDLASAPQAFALAALCCLVSAVLFAATRHCAVAEASPAASADTSETAAVQPQRA